MRTDLLLLRMLPRCTDPALASRAIWRVRFKCRHACLPFPLIHRLTADFFASKKKDAWALTMITGVALQGFGRLALAKVYVKTEAIINEAADAASEDWVSRISGRHDGEWGDEGSGGAGGSQGGSGGRPVSDRRADSPGLLRLNGVSSSIGGIRADKNKPNSSTNQFDVALFNGFRPTAVLANLPTRRLFCAHFGGMHDEGRAAGGVESPPDRVGPSQGSYRAPCLSLFFVTRNINDAFISFLFIPFPPLLLFPFSFFVSSCVSRFKRPVWGGA